MNTTTTNIKSIDTAIKKRKEELDTLQKQIDDANETYVNLEAEVENDNAKLLISKLEKYTNLFKISEMQIRAKKYDEIIAKSAKLSFPEAQLKQKLDEQRKTNQMILQSLSKIELEHPHFVNFTSPLKELL